jgi:hypothetical protein
MPRIFCLHFNRASGGAFKRFGEGNTELHAGYSALQACRRQCRMVDDDLTGSGLHPGTSLVDHANLQRLDRRKTKERGACSGGARISLFCKGGYHRDRQFSLIVAGKNRHDEAPPFKLQFPDWPSPLPWPRSKVMKTQKMHGTR